MPNAIDLAPLQAFARRAAARIADENVRERFERLAIDWLRNDARNFRPVLDRDLVGAPDWAVRAMARGDALVVFALNRTAARRIHTVSRRLVDTCAVANGDADAHPGYAPHIAAASEFIRKFDRVNFEVAARKALLFAHIRAAWFAERDDHLVCAAASVTATQGRIWSRIQSVGGLRRIGREFRNCLARAARSGAYGGALVNGRGQFWVLRDSAGVGLIIAFAASKSPTHFVEIKGPSNAAVSSEHPDVVVLAAALGMRPVPPPPPPSQPSSASAATLTALLNEIERAPSRPVVLMGNPARPLRRAGATT